MKIFTVLLILCSYSYCSAQTAAEVYKRPLKDVLGQVERKYNVILSYNDEQLNNLSVSYATWRFSDNILTTLDNILKPLDLVYTQTGKNSYQISQYEYYRRSEKEGKIHLGRLLSEYKNANEFDVRKKQLRECILNTLGINISSNRTPLNPITRTAVTMDGYSVANVAFESIPGYFVTGTLYKPTGGEGPYPVILCPHGHFYNEKDPSIAEDSGRYRPDMQLRCATLARMGAIVLSYDMYSWGESVLQTGGFAYHETSFSGSIQTWNSIRALDYLLSLPDADKNRVAVTGASGGGTQTILLAALDDRVTVSVPVVMVSSSFFGGCSCESGLPIHDECKGNKTNNAEIAAMNAPKPMLLISDGSDWTRSVPGTDYPYLKKIYGFYGRRANLESVYLINDKHDYGFSKRVPMYRFLAKHLALNLKAVTAKDGNISEQGITIQSNSELRVFEKDPLPAGALRSHSDIMKAFAETQNMTGPK